jgi:hypothetical protein
MGRILKFFTKFRSLFDVGCIKMQINAILWWEADELEMGFFEGMIV